MSALREREAELARVQQIGKVGGVEVDLRSGFRNRRSPEYLLIHGLPPSAANETHQDWVGRIHPDDRERTERQFLEAVAGHAVDYLSEYRIVRPNDGEVRWIRVVAKIERDEAGQAIRLVGAHIDITDRMLAQETLRESEERFRLIADSAPVPILVCQRDGKWEFANRALQAFLGTNVEDAPAFDWVSIVHPEDLPRILQEHYANKSSEKSFVLEGRFRRADGEWRWVRAEILPRYDAVSRHVGFIGVAYDITIAKQAEEDLKRINEGLHVQIERRTREHDRLWNVSQDLLLILDHQGRWLSVNPAWSSVLGWTETELMNGFAPATSLLPEPFLAAARDLVGFALDPHATRFENRFAHRDGTMRSISWTSVIDNDAIFAVGRDVTAEREAEAALRAAEDQLRQSHKMEAIGQLTGGIAHDFNNLLTGIIGGLAIVQRRIDSGRYDDVARFMQAATASAHRAAALTHRLLAFSRRQPLAPRTLDVCHLVRGMEEMIQRSLGEQVRLSIGCEALPLIVEADPHQLENAILNLAINARDAMPDGGKLTIACGLVAIDGRQATLHEPIEPGDYVAIDVRDHGVGMDAETIKRAFDPFFTTKPIGQGTGLGLSMVYGFAKQSKGHVRIDSQKGAGTTLTILLPQSKAGLDRAGAESAGAIAKASSGESILLVEDEVAVRLVVADLLSEIGYRVTQAENAPEALELLERLPDLHMLITDVGLPGMDGRQLAERVLASRPRAKVLFMTGYAERAIPSAELLTSGGQVIVKPFVVETFAETVRKVLDSRTAP
ncbi:MAG: PAS domain-containing protein [Xanthobacteraceae bacterium]